MSWAPVLRQASARLGARDARLLLSHALGIAPDRLTLHLSDLATPEIEARFAALVERRAGGEPVSKILGYRDFWKQRFIVTPDVLDPRPETEVLVAEALKAPFARVLDLGTGSGAILLSLLAERPAATGLGVDLSPAALAVAARNAEALGLAARAEFRLSDWFETVHESFDLIVSNPPYIAVDEMSDLTVEVRDHDPHMALTDGEDGLLAYRTIAIQALYTLKPGGRLLVEIGPTQGPAVAEIFAMARLAGIAILPDLDGRDRVVAARAP